MVKANRVRLEASRFAKPDLLSCLCAWPELLRTLQMVTSLLVLQET